MQLSNARVLVVDDDSVLRKLFVEWFRRMAASVSEAVNGAQAIEVVARQKFDLIVTDIRMPVLDGMGLLRHLRASTGTMPTVMCVSGNIDVSLPELYEMGAAAFLQKPVNRDEFLRAAQRSIRIRDGLWKVLPQYGAGATLNASYGSMAQEVSEKRMAFGRGGLCVRTAERLQRGPVDLELNFAQDHLLLSGRGVVQWTASGMAGIELDYLTEECRARVHDEVEGMRAFIPNLGCMTKERVGFRGPAAVAAVLKDFVVGAAGLTPATSIV